MSQTNPTPIDALPTAPSTSSPSTFAALADAFVAALATFRTQINTIATQTYNNAVDAYNSAVAAAASALTASAAAASSLANANATAWVSGATYAQGAVVWSLIDFLPYRRAIAGSGTTDPKNDPTNWVVQVAGDPQWTTITADPAPAVAGSSYLCNTSSAAFTVTLPAAPTANDVVRIADYAGTFATNNLTIGRSALNIMGLAEDMVISTNNASITLQYIDASRGWALV